MPMPPCKKDGVPCTKRKVGCHTTCPEMQEYRAKVDKANREYQKAKMFDLYVSDAKNRIKHHGAPLPSVVLKNKKKKRERSAGYNAKIKKIIKSGSTDSGG